MVSLRVTVSEYPEETELMTPWRSPVENLSSRRQKRKAQNMESQCGLRKDEYSSPQPVYICILHLPVPVSLTLTTGFDPFEKERRELYFCKECVTVSLFLLHHGYIPCCIKSKWSEWLKILFQGRKILF